MNETVFSSAEGSQLSKNLKSKLIWVRLLFMLIITFLYSVSRIVVGAVVIVQFFWVLFTKETNPKLQAFGKSLSTYTNEIILYLTFNTEKRPYPFDLNWPN